MKSYLLVNGNFVPANGMDMPNLALANFLAEMGADIHLVTHRAEQGLLNRPNVIMHPVPKPLNSYLLAAPVLDGIGRRWASKLNIREGAVVVNGGNCRWGDVNWVHYVHAAYRPVSGGKTRQVIKNKCAHHTFLAYERAALRQARVVIANSERTKQDLVERLGVAAERVRTVYYGVDTERFRPPTREERKSARVALGWSNVKPMVAFIGALGDRRKGFDKLFEAWKILCADLKWEADLVVVGTGFELSDWKARAAGEGLETRIHFMGFREDVPTILAACDALVAPTRYEAYGQGVHEALCCGLPALVSQTAGVAERYPLELAELLIPDPDDAADLVDRLRGWYNRAEEYRRLVSLLSEKLRAQTWNSMAEQIAEVMNSAA